MTFSMFAAATSAAPKTAPARAAPTNPLDDLQRWWDMSVAWVDSHWLQIGIAMHFSGAFVQIEGGRLYDAHVLGLRYDKYVHFVNAFSATLLVGRLFQIQSIALTRVNSVLLMLVVLGLGAVIEIVEYVVVLTVPANGVGGYDNNMQDLMANFCGASAFLLLRPALARLHGAIFRGTSGQGLKVGLGVSPERVI